MSNAPTFVIAGGDDDGAKVTTQSSPCYRRLADSGNGNSHVAENEGYIRAEARPGVVGSLSSSSLGTGGRTKGISGCKTKSAAKSLSAATLLLPTPGAPFVGGTASRKKAYKAAVFYGECHLAGISADDAEDAATGVSATHKRWWIDALHRKKSGRSSGGSSGAFDDESSSSSLGDNRPGAAFSVSTAKKARQHSSSSKTCGLDGDLAAQRKREKMGGVREIIERVSRRQDEQGGGYISPATIVSPSSADQTDESADDTDSGDAGKETSRKPRSADETSNQEMLGELSLSPRISVSVRHRAAEAKSSLLSSLAESCGDMTTSAFRSALDVLESYYISTGRDARRSAFTSSSRLSHGGSTSHSTGTSSAAELSRSFCRNPDLEGTWLSLSRPDYQGCLGTNDRSHYLYTLGRMSFDMFRPTHLKCSIQGEFNSVRVVDGPDMLPYSVPRRLKKEVLRCQHNGGRLRTYNIIVAFVIEPNQNGKGQEITSDQKKQGKNEIGKEREDRHHIITRPIRGIMTNLGYMLPDPNVPNRMSIWFTEGTLEVNDEEEDLEEWKRIFDNHRAPKRDLRERAHVLAAKVLLGANVPDTMGEDGSLSYSLTRPIGGHGLAFCDVLYLDDDLRILKGHHGQLYVSARVLTKQSAAASTSDLVGGSSTAHSGDLSKASPFQVSA